MTTKKKSTKPTPAEQIEPTPLTSEQWSQLCAAAAAWYMLTRTKITELYDSIERTTRALADPSSPLREFLNRDSLLDVRGFLQQAETRFPEFGTAAPTAMNLPDLMELLASFK